MSPNISIRRIALQLARVSSAALIAAIVAAPARASATDACDPSTSIIYSPAQGTFGTVLFEDSWPQDGDLDFNDQVVAYSYQFVNDASGNVVTMKADFSILAAGATYHNGIYLHLPIASTAGSPSVVDQSGDAVQLLATESDFVLPIVNDTRTLFSAGGGLINTDPTQAVQATTSLSFTITFATGVALDTSLQPFDLYIARSNDPSWQIHQPQFAGTSTMNHALFHQHDDRSNLDESSSGGADNLNRYFVDAYGTPFVLVIPDQLLWPQETDPIESVYPDLYTFALSAGTQDTNWYATDIDTTDAFTHGNGGAALPVPQDVGTDLSCTTVTYSPASVACVVDTPCSLAAPTVSAAASFIVSPALPSGLNLDPSTGAISGTASAVSASASYTVTATNPAGIATAAVTIEVDAAPAAPSASSPLALGAGDACQIVNGNVWCWGYNADGDLGINSTETQSNVPVQVVGLPGPAQSVSMGYYQSCAIVNGGAWCWGSVLGNGTYGSSPVPVQVSGLTSGVTQISAGSWHTCAVVNGGVYCWGDNGFGEVGDGVLNGDTSAPTPVVGLSSGVLSIAAGGYFTCALLVGGTVQCWGYSTDGQMGNGTTTQNNLSPTTPVTGLTGAEQIVAGDSSACALVNGGIKCWGYFDVQDVPTSLQGHNILTPVQIGGLTGTVLSIAEGGSHVCARLSTGVECFGLNANGELGNNTTNDSATAVSVVGLGTGVSVVAAGPGDTCVIDNGGTQCWGSGLYGSLGNNATADSSVPVTVAFPSQSINQNIISFGESACAIEAGNVWCWGEFDYDLGTGVSDPWFPTQVAGLPSGAQQIVGGQDANCALIGGEAWCWGSDYEGTLGDGTTTNTFTPTRVAGLSGITQISLGINHACAVANGAAYCWGGDEGGEIGNGVHNNTVYEATQVTGLSSGVTQISAGFNYSCAVVNGGATCWGEGDEGELGNQTGSPAQVTSPVQVIGLTSGVTQIAAGFYDTCAVVNGGVQCWGAVSLTPVPITGFSGPVLAISMGTEEDHACAVLSTGVECWGNNSYGQLGNNSTVASPTTAVPVVGITGGVEAVAAGEYGSCAVVNGLDYCWGVGGGSLGNGTNTSSLVPVQVSGLSGL